VGGAERSRDGAVKILTLLGLRRRLGLRGVGMADGVGNLMALQGRVTATGALVCVVGTTIAASGSSALGGVNSLSKLQGKVNASNELEMRVG